MFPITTLRGINSMPFSRHCLCKAFHFGMIRRKRFCWIKNLSGCPFLPKVLHKKLLKTSKIIIHWTLFVFNYALLHHTGSIMYVIYMFYGNKFHVWCNETRLCTCNTFLGGNVDETKQNLRDCATHQSIITLISRSWWVDWSLFSKYLHSLHLFN